MFYYFISFIILVRVVELFIAKRNERWLRSEGAGEYGGEHYKYFIILHTGFFISLITEYNLSEYSGIKYWVIVMFFVVQILRISIFISLGKYWNTKILVIKGRELVHTGLYRYFKHPNYVIVILEFLLIPFGFGLYITLIVFSMLNLLLLRVRLREEEKALFDNE